MLRLNHRRFRRVDSGVHRIFSVSAQTRLRFVCGGRCGLLCRRTYRLTREAHPYTGQHINAPQPPLIHTMSALPSSKKTHSEKHKLILKLLLKEAPNKVCVDCKTAAHPRWASWNLGCFMCIRCSGIHRSMGTHISRVKSVDLDAWTDEQVESMVRWGNAKCNGFWEAKLPDGYVPDSLKIENFIRTKYDMKKWAASTVVPDPLKVAASTTASASVSSAAPVSHSVTGSSSISSGLLLDDDFGVFTSSRLQTPTAPVPSSRTQPRATHPVQPATSTPTPPQEPPKRVDPRTAGRQDLKKSILSLYSSPSSSSISVPAHAPARPNVSTAGVTDSLAGLNFGPLSTAASTPSLASVSSTPKPQQWDNEWNSSSGSVNQLGGRGYNGTAAFGAPVSQPTPLDDDLFKNVWN